MANSTAVMTTVARMEMRTPEVTTETSMVSKMRATAMETKMEAVSVDFVKQHKPYQKA